MRRLGLCCALFAGLLAAPSRGGEGAAWEEGPLRILWRRDVGRAIEFPPLMIGQTLIVATTDPRVVACDAETGKRRWTRRFKDAITAPPAAAGSWVLVSTQRGGGEIRAIDLNSGKWGWVVSTGGAVQQVLATDTRVLTLSRKGEITCRNAADGAKLWSRTGLGYGPPDLALDSDRIFAPLREDSIWALRGSDGSRFWSGPAPGRGGGAPLLRGDTLYVARAAGQFHVIDALTGAILSSGTRDGLQLGAPLASRPGPITVSTGGKLEAGSAWSLELHLVPAGPPVLAGSLVLVLSRQGHLHAVPLARGRVAWTLDLPTSFLVPPVRDGQRLALAGARGDVLVYAPDH